MSSVPQASTALPSWVSDILRCPVTGSALTEQPGPEGTPELVATDPGSDGRLAYPVRDGIPVLLEHEARRV